VRPQLQRVVALLRAVILPELGGKIVPKSIATGMQYSGNLEENLKLGRLRDAAARGVRAAAVGQLDVTQMFNEETLVPQFARAVRVPPQLPIAPVRY
jgi:hypothetical protein